MADRIFDYTLDQSTRPQLGLIVLQSDVTLEDDLRRLLPADVSLQVTRVPSSTTVTSETLAEMEHHLAAAARVLPRGVTFDVLGYGCTSGTAEIGAARVAQCIRQGTQTIVVTEPVSALFAACSALRVSRIAFLSPYVESVSQKLRQTLSDQKIETPVFGTFAEDQEAKVARIDEKSLLDAACRLVKDVDIDAVFLSCTNLRTLDVIPRLRDVTGLPVLSSNLVLAWHMLHASSAIEPNVLPEDLLSKHPKTRTGQV
ncbi:MAG: Asp/Glu racemase [Paracoccaceae bacterium]|nr:Asp/Glu racemase [Paracoccaceae bacterium]